MGLRLLDSFWILFVKVEVRTSLISQVGLRRRHGVEADRQDLVRLNPASAASDSRGYDSLRDARLVFVIRKAPLPPLNRRRREGARVFRD